MDSTVRSSTFSSEATWRRIAADEPRLSELPPWTAGATSHPTTAELDFAARSEEDTPRSDAVGASSYAVAAVESPSVSGLRMDVVRTLR